MTEERESQGAHVLPEASQNLYTELLRQRAIFTSGADAKADFSAMFNSVSAVLTFLENTAQRDVSYVLLSLLTQLENIRRGRASAVLTPTKKPHGQSQSLTDESLWAMAAAIITLLIREGQKPANASKQVEKEFTLRNLALPGQARKSAGTSGKRLKLWRDRLLQGPRDSHPYLIYSKVLNDAHLAADQDGVTASEKAFTLLNNTL